MIFASIIGLLRTIGIIILNVLAWRLIRKYVVPFVLRWFVSKAQKKMQDQMRQQQEQFYGKKQSDTIKDDGKVKITRDPTQKNKGKSDEDFGEYVDFEEV
jgi:hypothetical protein